MNAIPDEYLPTNIFNSKKAPALWMGAGIPMRYVEGFGSWEDILRNSSSMAGIDGDRFVALRNLVKNELGPGADPEDIFSKLALELSNTINDMVACGELDLKTIFDEEQLKQYRHNVDPLKLMICESIPTEIRFKEDYSEEIALFRKLSESTPVVITTNYDYTIESLFNNQFKVYSNTDEYYFSDSVGFGEIYKIHGTVKRPSSIVIDSNDYQRFKDESFIITSKIVSVICECPLIIMGYSMGDKMIRDMICKMFKSFSDEKKKQLAGNILYIGYDPNTEPRLGNMQIQSDSGLFYIKTLTINDYRPVLQDLTECSGTMSTIQIRKIKRMISDVVSENPPKGRRIAYVGIEGIDDVDPKRTIIAFTSAAALANIKSTSRYSTDDLIKDILDNDVPKLQADSLVDVWFEGEKIGSNPFIPIFHYIRQLKRNPEDYSPKLKAYIEDKRKQYLQFRRKKQSSTIESVKSRQDFLETIGITDFKGDRLDLILIAFMKNWISEEEAIEHVRDCTDSMKNHNSTSVRRTITYLAFKEFE